VYPTQELTRLAVHKESLRHSVSLRRARCSVAAARVTRPLAWIDRARVWWRQFSPFALGAAASLGFLMHRRHPHPHPRLKLLRALMRWGPLAIRAVRLAAEFSRSRAGVDPTQGESP
jgi:hypothetical protein